jgi:hypothetical protein
VLATTPTKGTFACSEKYDGTLANNSLLDVIVGGCDGNALIKSTQPDQGTGTPYTLTTTTTTAGPHVTGCTDKNGTYASGTTAFTTCLQAAAYSSFFNFTSDRVIMK